MLGTVRRLLSGRGGPPAQPELIVVGLGNPGSEYARTRHNLGFRCVDRIAGDHAIDLARRHRTAIVGEGAVEGAILALAKPRTYVNRSGQAVAYLLARYRAPAERLLVIYDDIALPLGKIRLRPRGSAGGHNGIKSITEAIGTQEFPRLRVGIGSPPQGTGQVEYVLGEMSKEEEEVAGGAVERVSQATVSVLQDGIDSTMNRFN